MRRLLTLICLVAVVSAPAIAQTVQSDKHAFRVVTLVRGLQNPWSMAFLPDGRIAIAVSNVADVPVEVTIDAPLGIGGTVQIILPAGDLVMLPGRIVGEAMGICAGDRIACVGAGPSAGRETVTRLKICRAAPRAS